MNEETLKKLEQTMNRRSFLRGSGLAAAALLGAAALPLSLAAQDQSRQDVRKDDAPKEKPQGADQGSDKADQNSEKKDGQQPEEDEFKITRKDERGRDYRMCPQCGSNMYKQDRTWTCENCGYSYTE
jgi:ribosomal protein S27AE